MVAHVLRLRVDLLFGALRGDRRQTRRVVLGFLLLTAGTIAACVGTLTLRTVAPEVSLVVTVLGGSALTLGFALAPIIAGAGDPLDPRRFVVFGIGSRPLAAALALAGLISVPIAALGALTVCVALVWSAQGVAGVVAVIATMMCIATCALLVRVSMAFTSILLRDRRSRELTGLVILALLVVVVPVGVFLASLRWGERVPTHFGEAASFFALTPFGAAWAFPALFAQGSDAAWSSLAVAVMTLVLLGVAWFWLVSRVLKTGERPTAVRERGGLGWFAVAPGTAGGAIAARSLVYWLRDRRYLVNIVVIPVAALLTMVPLLVAGVPFSVVVLIPAPVMALFFGWLPHNDLAYDSTAVWVHIASGVRGVSDRLGRLVPVLVIGVPVLAVAIPVAMSLHGRWELTPAMVGVCASLLLCGLGLSSIASVAAPYAVSRPGESPFLQPQRSGSAGAIAQALVLFGAVLCTAPVLWWAWLAVTRDVTMALTTLWAGLAIGVFVLAVGVTIGAVVFERRGGRLMEFAAST